MFTPSLLAFQTVGFRGDIGYQTFLYTNVTEVRRVFMFLIERMPKETDKNGSFEAGPIDRKTAIEMSIARNVDIQLNAAWTPQYCKKFGIRTFGNFEAINASNNCFRPQNLIVPHATQPNVSNGNPIIGHLFVSSFLGGNLIHLSIDLSLELREFWLKRSPIIFQQTRSNNICASIIHKNDVDCATLADSLAKNFQQLLHITRKEKNAQTQTQTQRNHIRNVKSIQQLALNNVEIPNENDIVVMPEISEIDSMLFDIEKVKANIEQALHSRQEIQPNVATVQEELRKMNESLAQLRIERKIKERTSLLLENPSENLIKMETVLTTTQERINKLREQWEEHRVPLMQQLEQARQSSTTKYVSRRCLDCWFFDDQTKSVFFFLFRPVDIFQSHTQQLLDQIKLTREKADEITEDLKNKVAHHAQLVGEFEKNSRSVRRYVGHSFTILHRAGCFTVIFSSSIETHTHRAF